MALPAPKRVLAGGDTPPWAQQMATSINNSMTEFKTAVDAKFAEYETRIAALEATIADHEARLVAGSL